MTGENLKLLADGERWSELLASAEGCVWWRDEYPGVAAWYVQALLKLGRPVAKAIEKLDYKHLSNRAIVHIARTFIEARQPEALASFLTRAFSAGRTYPTLSVFASRLLKSDQLGEKTHEALSVAFEGIRDIEAKRFPTPDAEVPRLGPELGTVERPSGAKVVCFTNDAEQRSRAVVYRQLARSIDQGLNGPTWPSAGVLRNVFFDEKGLIWAADGRPLLNFGREATLDLKEAQRLSKAGKLRRIKQAILPLKPTLGYYHWLAECFPSLAWLLEPGAPKASIPLPLSAQAFKLETLRLAGFEEARIERFEGLAFAEELFFGSEIYRGIQSWPSVWPLYDRLFKSAEALGSKAGPKIYISRRDTKRRVMVNEQQLEDRLARDGFSILVLSQLSLPEKIAAFRDARVIVGAHGAGLTHMLFASPGAALLDIVPINPKVFRERRHFLKLCRIRGAHYVACLNEAPRQDGLWKLEWPAFEGALKSATNLANRSAAEPQQRLQAISAGAR